MDGDRLTLRQAREQGRIREFAEQAERDRKEACGSRPKDLTLCCAPPSNPGKQRIEHQVPERAVVRAVSELGEV